ncbi:hypothetical protein [Uliginosibacterium sp. TH139]|uniref:hypothetical protein n=1 Tax=Uliginosibacterium sp. TH139 TaxID=2067453 RepID=UPI00117C71BE|nr:hypothetical protein [Uliginosibacterium sp. TH139]
MTLSLDHFGLAIPGLPATPESRSYRPPSWPPPKDWICIEDENGNEVSRWGDPVWDLSPWGGKRKLLNFGDGVKINRKSPSIDPLNADDLRLVFSWRIWGPRGAVNLGSAVENFFKPVRKIFELCSREGILARDLMRHPRVFDAAIALISKSKYTQLVAELDRLIDARDFLGFVVVDRSGIRRLESCNPRHFQDQTPYIPPRIWSYQVTRLKSCLDEYLLHQKKIEECFRFCSDAYRNNMGRDGGVSRHQAPFQSHPDRTGKYSKIVFYGPFPLTAERYGLDGLLKNWVSGYSSTSTIQSFSAYLNLVQYAGLAYLINFSLMRVSEGASIRTDALVWEECDTVGRVLMIKGETTKTDQDSDALWVVSPGVEIAILAMKSIAALRASFPGASAEGCPYLMDWSSEPWVGGVGRRRSHKVRSVRPHVRPYGEIQRLCRKLFDPKHMIVTEDDLKLARAVTPTLDPDRYKVGSPWPLAWHQLRRTGAVNMFASGMVSDASIQFQLKHLTRAMPLYYGRGNFSLRLNEETRLILVAAQYEVMGRELASLHSSRYLSPHGDEHKLRIVSAAGITESVNLIEEGTAQRYEKAARKGKISFRRTPLGACMNSGRCDSGDCVESVGDCAGNSDTSPCAHVLFDRTRASSNQARLKGVKALLADTPVDSPRYRALEQERRGLENYFAYINQG